MQLHARLLANMKACEHGVLPWHVISANGLVETKYSRRMQAPPGKGPRQARQHLGNMEQLRVSL